MKDPATMTAEECARWVADSLCLPCSPKSVATLDGVAAAWKALLPGWWWNAGGGIESKVKATAVRATTLSVLDVESDDEATARWRLLVMCLRAERNSNGV